MDTLIAYWKHIWHRLLNAQEEDPKQPRSGEHWEAYVARLPVHKKFSSTVDGRYCVVVVRYVGLTGTWLTSRYFLDGTVTHSYGKQKTPRVKHGHRKRTIPSRQV